MTPSSAVSRSISSQAFFPSKYEGVSSPALDDIGVSTDRIFDQIGSSLSL